MVAERPTAEGEAREFGARLLALLRRRGWNQKELATRAGLSRDMVHHYVNGRHRPKAENASRLASALGVPLDVLLVGAPDSAPTSRQVQEQQRRLEIAMTGDGAAHICASLTLPVETALALMNLLAEAAPASEPIGHLKDDS